MAGPATAYQTGTHASRPANGAGCVLYSCTDHNLVYLDNGSSWSTLITLTSGLSNPMTTAGDIIQSSDGSGTPARLAIGSQGSYLRAGASAVEYQKNNLAATAAPDADNDVDEGYTVGSAWFDTTNDEVYFCVDNSDGAAVWKQVGAGGGGLTEHDYTEFTSPVTVSASTEGAADTVVTASAVALSSDTIWIEFFCPYARPDSDSQQNIRFVLYDGSSSIGILGLHQTPASANANTAILLRRRLASVTGTKTYSIRSYRTGIGDASVTVGAGGSGNVMPGYIRITSG